MVGTGTNNNDPMLHLLGEQSFQPTASVSMSQPLDEEIDEIDPSEKWTPEEREEYFKEMEECPLLMKDYTEVRPERAGTDR